MFFLHTRLKENCGGGCGGGGGDDNNVSGVDNSVRC